VLQLLQLGLIWYFVLLLRIESDLWLERFLPVAISFFAIHSLTPIRYKPIVFFASFLSVLFLFVGAQDAWTLLAMGLALLGLCHAPIPLILRKLIILGIGIFLLFARLGYAVSPLSSHGLTIFAAIFMFRTIVYLYELKHERESTSFWHRINYFFLLPNIVFPLFPIVDYKTYLTSYYNQEGPEIYQRGINLILWSIICLVMYRCVYFFAVPDLDTIDGVAKVGQYIIATYLTVIRLVGILSFSVGVLRLFGYNLPDIFKSMFLAHSFSDLFRRINIYWKSFLMKICYYPVYFKLRKKVPRRALLFSAIITFFFTWVFHIYQWIWILGSNPIRLTSILYWGIFGCLATASMMLEKKNPKEPKNYFESVLHSAKVLGVFLTIAILYSMWTQATVVAWLAIVKLAFLDSWSNWLTVLATLLVCILIGGLGFLLYFRSSKNWKWPAQSPIASFLTIGILYILFFSLVDGSESSKVIAFAEGQELNENDATLEYEGYYEDVLKVDISSQLWDDQIHSFLISKNWTDIPLLNFLYDTYRGTSMALSGNEMAVADLSFADLEFTRKTEDVLRVVMNPNVEETYKGKRFTTNQWGMRDQPYNKVALASTLRIAIVGGSPTMGSGVHDEEVFEALTEARLNQHFGTDSLSFELLNFSIGSGAQTFQLAFLLEEQIQTFKPDYVILVDHFSEERMMFNKIKQLNDDQSELYPELERILQRQGLDRNRSITPQEMVESESFIMEWSIFYFAGLCKKYEIEPILLYYPSLNHRSNFKKYKLTIENAGFHLINLENVFKGISQKKLHASEHDKHPNAKAHTLISDALYEELVQHLKLK